MAMNLKSHLLTCEKVYERLTSQLAKLANVSDISFLPWESLFCSFFVINFKSRVE